MRKQTALLFGTFASALVLFSASAADPAVDAGAGSTPPSAVRRDGEGGRRGGHGVGREGHRGPMGLLTSPRAEAEAKIKEKFPEEYAAVEKLRAEAEAKLQELAKKAGIEIPKSLPEQLAELKEAYPKEMAEIEELGKTNGFAALLKIRELAEKAGIKLALPRMGGPRGLPGYGDNSSETPPPPLRENPRRQIQMLRRKFPKEMAEIDRLRRSDPAAAQEKTLELLKKLKEENPAEKPL